MSYVDTEKQMADFMYSFHPVLFHVNDRNKFILLHKKIAIADSNVPYVKRHTYKGSG
jgi:hypothetical protein